MIQSVPSRFIHGYSRLEHDVIGFARLEEYFCKQYDHSKFLLSMILFRHAMITILILTSLCDLSSQSKNRILMRVNNIKEINGSLMVAIYNNRDSFLGEEVFKGAIQRVENVGTMEFTIDNIPFGIYAISIYHDRNDNGKLDTKIFKLPKEPFGFSNNAKNKFGPPSFDKAMFEVKDSSQLIEITLR